MGVPKQLREARDRLADVEAKIAVHDKRRAELEAAAKPAKTALEALRKRSKPAIVFAAQEYRVLDAGLADIGRGWSGEGKGLTGKKLAAAIVAGEVSLSTGSGSSTKAKGLQQRLRVPSKAAILRIRRARAKANRASQAYSRATQLLRDAIRESYVEGGKVEVETLAKVVARRFELLDAISASEPGMMDEYNRQRLVDYDLADAKTHLGHAKAVAAGTAPETGCPCHSCAVDRSNAEREAARVARITALPSAMKPCPTHGRKRMHVERVLEWHGNERIPVPVAWCPVGWHRVDDVAQLAADKAKAEKAAAKAAKKAPRLEWVCPNPECGGERNPYAPIAGIVECDNCGAELDADVVKTVKPEKPEVAPQIAA
jgi:hypothetical protein